MLNRRSGLEKIQESLKSRIGQTTAASQDRGKSIASKDSSEIAKLQKELSDTTSALEGTKKAIDVLSNDTRTLAAIEQNLANINESRLSGRQRSVLLSNRLAGESDPAKRQKIFNEALKPIAAVGKAISGKTLSESESAALQQGLAEGPSGQIGEFLRQQGVADEDIPAKLEEIAAKAQAGALKFRSDEFNPSGDKGTQTAIDAFFAKGRADTVIGTSAEEVKGLKDREDFFELQQQARKGTSDANVVQLEEQQRILQRELEKTKESLIQTAIAFEKLRSALPLDQPKIPTPPTETSTPPPQTSTPPPKKSTSKSNLPFDPNTFGFTDKDQEDLDLIFGDMPLLPSNFIPKGTTRKDLDNPARLDGSGSTKIPDGTPGSRNLPTGTPLPPGSTTLRDGVTPLPRGMQVNENGKIDLAPSLPPSPLPSPPRGRLMGPNGMPAARGAFSPGAPQNIGQPSDFIKGGLSSAADQKFAKDIEVAASTLSTLPELQVAVNGNVGPVEVVLNGTQLLTEFKQEFLNGVIEQISAAIQAERTDLV